MLDKDEIAQMKKVCEALVHPVQCTLYPAGESGFGRKMKDFVEEICGLSQGKIRAATGDPDPDFGLYPSFRIGNEGCANIVYAAIPLGHQFQPFIHGLERIGAKSSAPLRDGETGSPAEIQVLISESCPRCPVAVGAALQLSTRNSSIESCIVDAAQFPDIVKEYWIKSVPATILDRRLVLVGGISADRLLELVNTRGTLKFEMEVVQSLIDRGRISEAAAGLDQDAGREVVVGLMQSPDFSKRLSGLVVVEKALDENPGAVRTLMPSLVEMLRHDDSRIRGDIADLCGKIGDPQAIPQLEPLLADPDPDVAEAAAEAIEELRKLH